MIRHIFPICGCLITYWVEAQVVINEVCSRNHSVLEDVDGRHPDWLELHNIGAETIDLTGYFLTDRIEDPTKFQLPSIQLPADGYVLFYSGESTPGDQYFPFGISGDGETIFLSDPDQQVLDHLEVPYLQADHSFGRTSDGPRFFDQPTPMLPNFTEGFLGYAQTPVFSPAPGIYVSAVEIELSAVGASAIHYTIDGRLPDQTSSMYQQPFQLGSSAMLRAIATAPGMLPSAPVGGSYLIGIDHQLPILSLAVDPDSMFHVDLGIYMLGPNADTAYPYHGANFWSGKHIPAHIEFIENGVRRVSQSVDLRIQGGSSARPKPQKPLRLTARNKYGQEFLEYPFFPERPYMQRYKQLVLRNSGGDFCHAHFRDGLFHQIALHNELDIDVLAYRPMVVYINGEYWGLMNLRERISPQNIALLHDLDEDEIILLDGENVSVQGDTMQFFELKEFIRLNDMNDPIHFAHVDSLLDVNSFTDYFVLEMYAGNTDWPANNIRYWKPSITKGKWRYLLHDLDATMNIAGYIPMDVDMFHWVLVHREGFIHSEIFRGLLGNAEFKRKFINRFADLMNTAFSPERFQHEVDLITSAIRPEIFDHFERWQQWSELWRQHAEVLIPEFAQVRPGFVREDIIEEFSLAGEVRIEFDVYPPEGGTIKVNTVSPELPFEGIYFDGNEIDVSIEPAAGYNFDHWEYSAEPDLLERSMAIRKNFSMPGKLTAVMRQELDGLTVWPNPVRDELIASYNTTTEGIAHITLHDAHGRLIFDDVKTHFPGTNRLRYDLDPFPPGMYFLSAEFEGIRQSSRVIKISL